MGTPDFAIKTLECLIEEHEVVAVITQPDKKKGRGNKFQFTPIKEIALKNNIEVLQPEKIKSKSFVQQLKKYEADVFVVVAYGQMLSEEILQMPKFGSINVHGSLLPKYRGAAPIQWAVINGEKQTGVTIMHMAKGCDTGDMILKATCDIEDEDTGGSIHDKLSEIGAKALIEALVQIENGTAKREKQDDSKFTYAKMLTKDMGHIDFNKTTSEIINLVRGLNPWPSAFVYYNEDILKIWECKNYISNIEGENGQIVEILKKDGFVIKTSDGYILVTQIQLSSGKKMKTSDFLRGNEIVVGTILS